MGDEALFAFLNGTGGMGQTGASVDDINAFNSQIGQNDIFSQLAPAISGARFNTSTWSPGTQLGVSAGQAFLGAILQGIGQNQRANQLEKVAQVLPQLYADPNSVAVPEGVDGDAFGSLKLRALSRNAAQKSNTSTELIKNLLGVQLKGMEAKASAEGKIAGENAAYGATGGLNPDSPINKKATEFRDRFNALEEVQNFKYVSRVADQLAKTLQNPGAVSDTALSKMAVQLIEPRLSSNAGETSALGKSGSIPETWKADIQKSLNGGSGLSPTIRAGLLDLAKSAYQAHGNLYTQTYDSFAKDAELYKITPDRFSSIGKPKSFEELTGTGKAGGASTVSRAAVDAEAATLAGQGYSGAALAAELRKKFEGKTITSGNSPRG